MRTASTSCGWSTSTIRLFRNGLLHIGFKLLDRRVLAVDVVADETKECRDGRSIFRDSGTRGMRIGGLLLFANHSR